MLDVGNLTWSGIAATTPHAAVANQVAILVVKEGLNLPPVVA
jgi:hypothetical protein